MADKEHEKSMLEVLGEARERLAEPKVDPLKEKSFVKITDFSPSAGRYVRQQRLTITIKHGRDTVFKDTVSGLQMLVHTDQFAARDSSHSKMLVDSDETVLVFIATKFDVKNFTGRNARKKGVEPVASLADTIRRAVFHGFTGGQDPDPEDAA